MGPADVARATLIVLLLVGLALLLAQVASVLLLLFAAILVAVLLRTIADQLEGTGLPDRSAVLVAVLLIALVLAGVGWLFGAQLGSEFNNVAERLPGSVGAARAWLERQPLGASLASASPDVQKFAERTLTIAFGAAGAIGNIILVLIGAIYLALDPRLYARGVTLLFPKSWTGRAEQALSASGRTLRKYLLAQLFTMTVVGTLVGLGLTLVGVESAAALGLIVGLCNFIPLLGPVIGAVPGLLLAFTAGGDTLLLAALVYLIAQQIEGNVITPIVQQRAVSIPPALLIFSLAGLGVIFGLAGVILSAPLAVVLYTLVAMLWSRDMLGHDVDIPGS